MRDAVSIINDTVIRRRGKIRTTGGFLAGLKGSASLMLIAAMFIAGTCW